LALEVTMPLLFSENSSNKTLLSFLTGKKLTEPEKRLKEYILFITGKKPKNLALYVRAFTHKSAAKNAKESNERLEYLGDAIIGAIVAEFLYKKYPGKDEGFLTQIRSKIVNRASLNQIAIKIGIRDLISHFGNLSSRSSTYGNAFEAFMGAVYLERGYNFSYHFFTEKLLKDYVDIEQLITAERDFKSKIINWAQKDGKKIIFADSIYEEGTKNKMFLVKLYLGEEFIAEAIDFSKKGAEQIASEQACQILNIN